MVLDVQEFQTDLVARGFIPPQLAGRPQGFGATSKKCIQKKGVGFLPFKTQPNLLSWAIVTTEEQMTLKGILG